MSISFDFIKACSYGSHLLQRIAAGVFAGILICSCTNKQLDDELQKIEKNQIKPSGVVIDYPKYSTLFPQELPATTGATFSQGIHLLFFSKTWHSKQGQQIYRSSLITGLST